MTSAVQILDVNAGSTRKQGCEEFGGTQWVGFRSKRVLMAMRICTFLTIRHRKRLKIFKKGLWKVDFTRIFTSRTDHHQSIKQAMKNQLPIRISHKRDICTR